MLLDSVPCSGRLPVPGGLHFPRASFGRPLDVGVILARGDPNFRSGICQVMRGDPNFRSGICQVMRGDPNFRSGTFHVARGDPNFRSGTFHVTRGDPNFRSGICITPSAEVRRIPGPRGDMECCQSACAVVIWTNIRPWTRVTCPYTPSPMQHITCIFLQVPSRAGLQVART